MYASGSRIRRVREFLSIENDLRHALEREDFENVETVIASGNVLFEHEERPSAGLSEKLEYIVQERFDFESVALR